MNNKKLAIIMILIMAISSLSLMMVKPAFAKSTPTPVIPEFTIEPVGPSFEIPPTYSFNSSSGFFYVNEGYHFEYSTVEVIIKNQAFTNQTNIDHLLYNVRLKPHNYPDSYWQELFNPNLDGFPIQTSSNFTIIPIAAEGATELQYQIPAGATTDVQVKAMIGHIERGFNSNATSQIEIYPYVFVGQTSGWSDTHTVTLPPKVPITVSSPTPSPTVPELPSWTIPLMVTIMVATSSLLVNHKKHKPKKFSQVATLNATCVCSIVGT
jgi:hypothetical protein